MLKENKRIAKYWEFDEKLNKVICHLCPRNCQLKDGKDGFCKVRGNEGNKLYTYNYGKSIEATIETIETEAVYHFSPGSRILSLGNIGCMMACSFCQNWQTSQVKHLNFSNVKLYKPEDVIKMAIENKIEIISWTYNDPVVWQEFVVETSKLAQLVGIKTLYKSALYIESAPLQELIGCIDIFSISLKSMDDNLYRKVTKGRLQPVLDAIKQIAKSERHLEISQLIVTDLNDTPEDAKKTAEWMVDNLGTNIPLHFVAYHPAYKFDRPRTSIEKLINARNIAKNIGIKYCYLGNIYHDDVSNTHCQNCQKLIIQRFGLTVQNAGLDNTNSCMNCGQKSTIIGNMPKKSVFKTINSKQQIEYEWEDEINSIHIVHSSSDNKTIRFNINRMPSQDIEYYELNEGIERLIISKSSDKETSIIVNVDTIDTIVILPVLDRAHFPVLEESVNNNNYIS